MSSNTTEYDVAIIGAGFAGLSAMALAHKRGLRTMLIADGLGATAHFSGAFDLADSRFSLDDHFGADATLVALFADFVRTHPEHIYNELNRTRPDFSKHLLAAMRAVLDFYGIAFRGDGVAPQFVFGSAGIFKPTAFAMPSHALSAAEFNSRARVAVVSFSLLKDYPAALIAENLRRTFTQVDIIETADVPVNLTSPLASLLLQMDQSGAVDALAEKLRGRVDGIDFLFLPPILGQEKYFSNHRLLEERLGVRVIELLSALPSTAGLRCRHSIESTFTENKIPLTRGCVTGFTAHEKKIISVTVQKQGQGEPVVVCAKDFILATGKFIGGGIQNDGRFAESIFNLPLALENKTPLGPTAHVTQLISPNGLERQRFLSIGVTVDTKAHPVFQGHVVFENLKACGQIRSGFDFTRDRCGFGLSVATALQCFES